MVTVDPKLRSRGFASKVSSCRQDGQHCNATPERTMANDKVPTVGTLDKPEKLDELLKQDRGEDCLPCRLVGESNPSERTPFPLWPPDQNALLYGTPTRLLELMDVRTRQEAAHSSVSRPIATGPAPRNWNSSARRSSRASRFLE